MVNNFILNEFSTLSVFNFPLDVDERERRGELNKNWRKSLKSESWGTEREREVTSKGWYRKIKKNRREERARDGSRRYYSVGTENFDAAARNGFSRE